MLATSVNSEADLTAVGLNPVQARALFSHLQEWKSEGLQAESSTDEKSSYGAAVLQSARADFSKARLGNQVAQVRLRQAARSGNHIAQGYLSILRRQKSWSHAADMLTECADEDLRYTVKALPQLQVDANKGCPYANYLLAEFIRGGQAVAKDPDEVFRIFKLAAEAGSIDAMRALGECYMYGMGV